ncbi:MAG: extracellular solute-binding protein [Microthrixaceae bacterium]
MRHPSTGRPTRRLATLLAGSAMALVAAACGGGVEQESSGSPGASGSSGSSTTIDTSKPVTVYLGRHYGIEPVFAEFTRATGIPVEFTTGKDPELRERLVVEGRNTTADVYLAADAGNLELAEQAGVLAPAGSEVLEEAVPERLRDEDGAWHGLSVRARTIVTSSERVADADVPTGYDALGDAEWKGRLCLRPSTHPYTQSLVSSLIAERGEDGATEVVESWVGNEPTYIDSDTEILGAIASGRCDAAIVNSYYLPRLEAEKGEQPVRLSWVTDDPGVHVNISGAGITRNADNQAGARRLIEWLATDGQARFAEVNFEFPANPDVAPRAELAAFGPFTPDPVRVERFGTLQPDAVMLLDRAGYQ